MEFHGQRLPKSLWQINLASLKSQKTLLVTEDVAVFVAKEQNIIINTYNYVMCEPSAKILYDTKTNQPFFLGLHKRQASYYS